MEKEPIETLPILEESIAFHSDSPESNQGQCARLMDAAASAELGGRVAIGLLSETIGDPSNDLLAVTAIKTMARYFATHVTTDVSQAISASLAEANLAIRQEIKRNPALKAKGASALVAVIAADRLFLGSVGAIRALLLREGEIRPVAATRTWLQHASESWQLTPGEIHESIPEPVNFLGSSDRVTPQLAPVDFIWPGDTLLLVNSRLANRVRASELRDIVATGPTKAASARIIDTALERGGPANLTALLISLPRATEIAAAPVSRVSPAVKGLIIGNALLILFIAIMLFQSGGLQNVFAPAPTVEVAKPIFMPTPTLLPPAGLDVDPFAPTPTDPFASATTVAQPAAAPTLSPAPTFTPIPVPPGWRTPSAPVPIVPANGAAFGGPDAQVILAWEPVNNLTEDMFYVVTIRKLVSGKLTGESNNWTKSTRIRLDSSFYSAMNSEPSRFGLAAPIMAPTTATFEWSVKVSRLTAIAPDGTLTGIPVSPSSPKLTFTWGPAIQQSPTRAYGAEASADDPFFQEQEQRQAASSAVLSPVSAGMAGLWLAAGILIGIPKLGKTLRGRVRRLRRH